MNRPIGSFRQQRGQVAVIMAIVIVLLIMMIGLVVDLGYLYTRKTELQNAADAAALAGAKELNGTAAGINNAYDMARDLANDNNVNFGGEPVEIPDETTAAYIEFGPTPDGPWTNAADSQSVPGDKRFIKVDTSGIALSTVQTWFMRVAQWGFGGIESTTTFGRAVAGPNIVDIVPIAACVLDPDDCPPSGTGNCGYRKGQSYKLSEINPIGPGTLYWINPVTTNAGECSGTGSTDYTLPFICQGTVAANVAAASEVLTNTGVSVPQLAALDSRFDDYAPQAKCDPATAPPDKNIKEYLYDEANWMSPAPVGYTSPIDGAPCDENQDECQAARVSISGGKILTDSGGVVWSFVRPENSPITNGPWPITGDTGRSVVAGNYPGGTGTPYSQIPNPYPGTETAFFKPPSVEHQGIAESERRVLTLMIVNCPTAGGSCRPATVRTRARFLLQRKADVPGDKDIYLEFGGTVSVSGITAIYKLYR